MALHYLEVLSIDEITDIRRDELQQSLKEIGSKAAQLEAQLAVLTAEHAKLLKTAFIYKAVLAPWKEVPNEILQRIFCCTKATEVPICAPFSRTVAPMQLTQVCSRWRAVAFATPTLWQDLKCTIYLSPDKYERQEIQAFIQDWISRAGDMPLSIIAVPPNLGFGKPAPSSIPQFNFAPTPTLGQFGQGIATVAQPLDQGLPHWVYAKHKFNFIKDIVIPNASKIRDLHITLPSYYRHSIALLQQKADFSVLEDFHLDISDPAPSYSRMATPPAYLLLKNAPQLEKFKLFLKFHGLHITAHTQLHINWSRMTHFETATMPSAIFLQILDQARNLQYCKAALEGQNQGSFFGVTNAANQNAGPGANINLPSLHTLDLSTGFGSLELNIQSAHLPNLKILSLSITWIGRAPQLLQDTIALSECRLTTCGGQSQSINQNTLREFLSLPSLSQLTHLTIPRSTFGTNGIMSDNTIQAIAHGHLVPHLHTFHFEGGMSSNLSRSIINLLVTKGFLSPHDGSTVFPNPKGSKRVVPASHVDRSEGVGVPFRHVKVYGLGRDPDLEKIVEQVGSECFTMGMLETDKWDLVKQIKWEED
ncbi:hypothetical protein BDN72DRAFT_848579 [Pluteus cervinus]|uniref:Uncharacterized protein n=1 Tax=Pluteus cervinus TaxID=181527 RepID=A0ACD3AA26_9AGAR|nr:hypothetical protein BDN72DRAFT_848579 [Pluteus cervinus]